MFSDDGYWLEHEQSLNDDQPIQDERPAKARKVSQNHHKPGFERDRKAGFLDGFIFDQSDAFNLVNKICGITNSHKKKPVDLIVLRSLISCIVAVESKYGRIVMYTGEALKGTEQSYKFIQDHIELFYGYFMRGTRVHFSKQKPIDPH